MTQRLAPWDESYVDITPTQFEKQVCSWFKASGHEINDLHVVHDQKLDSHDGQYQIDVYAEFEQFGATFKVLIECKKHKNAIKRDVVQLLHGKLQSTGCHKGFIFATTGFQSGAIKYAEEHGIALVRVMDGKTIYETKSQNPTPQPNGLSLPEYAGQIMYYGGDEKYGMKLLTEEFATSLSDTLKK
ncbi:TPA: restriction endonuclease, partial [Vibrio cholerae]|nr:restriction endonuclease [Vibrio cholerae]